MAAEDEFAAFALERSGDVSTTPSAPNAVEIPQQLPESISVLEPLNIRPELAPNAGSAPTSVAPALAPAPATAPVPVPVPAPRPSPADADVAMCPTTTSQRRACYLAPISAVPSAQSMLAYGRLRRRLGDDVLTFELYSDDGEKFLLGCSCRPSLAPPMVFHTKQGTHREPFECVPLAEHDENYVGNMTALPNAFGFRLVGRYGARSSPLELALVMFGGASAMKSAATGNGAAAQGMLAAAQTVGATPVQGRRGGENVLPVPRSAVLVALPSSASDERFAQAYARAASGECDVGGRGQGPSLQDMYATHVRRKQGNTVQMCNSDLRHSSTRGATTAKDIGSHPRSPARMAGNAMRRLSSAAKDLKGAAQGAARGLARRHSSSSSSSPAAKSKSKSSRHSALERASPRGLRARAAARLERARQQHGSSRSRSDPYLGQHVTESYAAVGMGSMYEDEHAQRHNYCSSDVWNDDEAALHEASKRVEVSDTSASELLLLRNRQPTWDEGLCSWCLDFSGRATRASEQNLILETVASVAASGTELLNFKEGESLKTLGAAADSVESGGQERSLSDTVDVFDVDIGAEEQNSVVLRLGQLGADEYALDYRAPLSPIVALATAAAIFVQKIKLPSAGVSL